MLNQIILVGRLAKEVEIKDNIAIINLAIPRSFKNENGEYETDFVDCVLNGQMASSTKEYCKKGDILGIKGRIQTNDKGIEVIAEKVTFLSANKD